MKEAFVCVSDEKNVLFFKFAEGDGCNLWEEDIEEGYVDYIMADIYEPDCWQGVPSMQELDGAQIMLDKLCEEMTMKEFIERGLEFWYEDVPNYTVIESIPFVREW